MEAVLLGRLIETITQNGENWSERVMQNKNHGPAVYHLKIRVIVKVSELA
jgi:hypothetical protein